MWKTFQYNLATFALSVDTPYNIKMASKMLTRDRKIHISQKS